MVDMNNNFLNNLKLQATQRKEQGKKRKVVKELTQPLEIKKNYQEIYSNILKEFTELMGK
ncbi:MAG: hypothetical protein JXA99_16065 [Candidatus Lokiarchaeota archaeon]|nr:hypothetical protein [Candidatus Lokiarchaeota archaeon]